ncbi:MAG: hypothetical protein ACRD0Z_02700 [Acidimicrobiales bacterium]
MDEKLNDPTSEDEDVAIDDETADEVSGGYAAHRTEKNPLTKRAPN